MLWYTVGIWQLFKSLLFDHPGHLLPIMVQQLVVIRVLSLVNCAFVALHNSGRQ